MEGHLHWGVSVPWLHMDKAHLPAMLPALGGRVSLTPSPIVAPSTLNFMSQHSNTAEAFIRWGDSVW